MYELAWTALGIAIAITAIWVWSRTGGDANGRRSDTLAATADEPVTAAAATTAENRNELEPDKQPEHPPSCVTVAVAPDCQRMALSLANELASLVSGVHGRAHHLIEAAPTPSQLPPAAQALMSAVQRLGTLHTKLIALGHGRAVAGGSTEVAELIASLSDELQQMQLGLELHWEPPPNLPRIAAGPDDIRDALLLLCAALLRAERGATRLSFVVETSFSRERPTVKIELALEWITDGRHEDPDALQRGTCALDLEAANHLIGSYGGELTLCHIPAKSVSAVVRLPIAMPEQACEPTAATPAEADDAAPDPGHEFGGALVLESDPALRAVLARELKASGRAVFACADGESAHTFLEATPDRFELLIVDDAQQLDERTVLAQTIRSRAPGLKIFLLTPSSAPTTTAFPSVFCLQKPFGVHELRRKLARILTAG